MTTCQFVSFSRTTLLHGVSKYVIPSVPVIQVFSFTRVPPPKPCIRHSSHPYAPHVSPIPFFSIFITQTLLGEQYRSLSSSLCSFLHFPVTSSVLDPNILLSTLFSNTLSLCSSFNVREKTLNPYQATGHNYSSVYIEVYFFVISEWKTKCLHRMIISIA